MTVKIITPNGGSDALEFGCSRTLNVAAITATEISSGESKLELKTTTSGTIAAKMTIAANGTVTLTTPLPVASGGTGTSTGIVASASGDVKMFAGASIASGWLACDGALVSRSTYSALFTAIGTAWGAGDGSSTFALPDLRGRAPIGVGTGASLTGRALAATGGAETHTLSTAELAAHTHLQFTYNGGASNIGVGHAAVNQAANQGQNTSSTGGGGAHNNVQPFAVINFIIKT